MAHTYNQYKDQFSHLWDTMVIKDSWKSPVYRKARQIVANKDKYQTIASSCGGNIPWYFIGVIHSLECGLNFNQHLHNGDPLTRKTRLVPAGRPKNLGNGPFSFNESAVDALCMKGFHEIGEWPVERVLYELERYNGWGYRNKGKPLSPYLWSGTQHYTKGKYVADHVYSSSAVSQQLGCAPLVKAILEIDTPQPVEEAVKDSRRMSAVERAKKFTVGLGVPGLISWNTLDQVKQFTYDHTGIILLVVAGLAFVTFKYIEFLGHREVSEGRYQPSGKEHKKP